MTTEIDTTESKFRIYQYETNALTNDDGWRIHAGDWIVQRQDEHGNWRNYDGPYAPHEKATAIARLKEFQDAELPQLFNDI